MNAIDGKECISFLIKRFRVEEEKDDRSGVYAFTQRLIAYNSNRIEGSTLTEEQPSAQKLIKRFHYEFKSGVFEDRANGLADGGMQNGRTGRLILFRECLKDEKCSYFL